jgi:hypothetical protein
MAEECGTIPGAPTKTENQEPTPMKQSIDTERDIIFTVLLHGALRATPSTEQEGTDEEHYTEALDDERAARFIDRLANFTPPFQKILNLEEQRLVAHLISHKRDFGEAPTRIQLEELVRQHDPNPDGQLALLGDYDRSPTLARVIDSTDLVRLFELRAKRWARAGAIHMLEHARIILEVGLRDGDEGPLLNGVDAMRKYLLRELLDPDLNELIAPGGAE